MPHPYAQAKVPVPHQKKKASRAGARPASILARIKAVEKFKVVLRSAGRRTFSREVV